MKVTLKYGIATYSGTIDDITFGSYKNDTLCIARKWVMPRLTDQNTEMSAIAKNLSTLYGLCSTDYKADLKTYAYQYGKEHSAKDKLAPNAYSIFIKMMFAFQKGNEASVTLDTITYSDIQSLFPDITTVGGAVDSGYLPNVEGAELLDAEM
ncbi:MAG TPA: hypothetical protein PLO57_02750 [Candidatus Cloacimonadota bacterium]|nr:hypothetical protein [Candidatus Cloacimonadota bacterium]